MRYLQVSAVNRSPNMAYLDPIKDEAAKLTTVSHSAIQMLKQLAQLVMDNRGDPDTIAEIAREMHANAADLSDAMTANAGLVPGTATQYAPPPVNTQTAPTARQGLQETPLNVVPPSDPNDPNANAVPPQNSGIQGQAIDPVTGQSKDTRTPDNAPYPPFSPTVAPADASAPATDGTTGATASPSSSSSSSSKSDTSSSTGSGSK
jgi:hypothetical protein